MAQAEKAELLEELRAAQQRLAAAEASAAGLSELERAELEKQVEDARCGGCEGQGWGAGPSCRQGDTVQRRSAARP